MERLDMLCRKIAEQCPDWAENGMAVQSLEWDTFGIDQCLTTLRRVGGRWVLEAGTGTDSRKAIGLQGIVVQDGVAYDYALGHLLERSVRNGPAWRDSVTVGGLLMKYLPYAVIEEDCDLEGTQVGWTLRYDQNHLVVAGTKTEAILQACLERITQGQP